ncbi:hypothetical protein ACWCP6_17765 [Streptomyces sp. NPDC002004]
MGERRSRLLMPVRPSSTGRTRPCGEAVLPHEGVRLIEVGLSGKEKARSDEV